MFWNTKNEMISKSTDLVAWYDRKIKDQRLVNAEEFQETNSGWSLIEIINLLVNVNKYSPFQNGLRGLKIGAKKLDTYGYFSCWEKYFYKIKEIINHEVSAKIYLNLHSLDSYYYFPTE